MAEVHNPHPHPNPDPNPDHNPHPDPQVIAVWLKSKEAVKRFQVALKESRTM